MRFVRVISLFHSDLLDCRLNYRVLLLVHIITLLDTDTAFISGISGEVRGFVQQLHPFRGLGKPEDVANAAIFLASEENTWVTGIGLPVKGGYTSL